MAHKKSAKKHELTIRENQQGSVYVSGAREEMVESTEDMLLLLEKGVYS